MIVIEWLITVNFYFILLVIVTIIIEQVFRLYLSYNEFKRKKSENRANSAATIWSLFYFIFTITGLFILHFKQENWKALILCLVLTFFLYKLFYKFYYNFQGRKKRTEFKKKFDLKFRSFRNSIF